MSTTPLAVAADQWRAIVAAATAAPSTHNSQPWRFVIGPDVAELHLDTGRLLPVIDPAGREARISCGAALLNAELALRAIGLEPDITLLPMGSHPTMLAMIRPMTPRSATPGELALHRAIPQRHSHRHPFHPAPVPPSVLQSLVYAAATDGAYLRTVQDQRTVRSLSTLIRRADHQQSMDPAYQAELAAWTSADRDRRDGVPEHAGGPRPAVDNLLVLREFPASRQRPVRDFESDPLLAVLSTAGDTARDQLRAGRALQRALLTATVHGLGASIISAPIELPLTRAALRTLMGNEMSPQLVLRFGMAVAEVASPRRPVEELIDWRLGPSAGPAEPSALGELA